MDKITHQVRAEHWARILNECMNSGMSKTAWCRANGISEKQFFYWQRILRRGIDGLASIVKFNFQLDPYEKDILFLFCGRRSDRIKGLVWEGRRIPSPLQKAGAWRLQLAPYKRRGIGDHAGTIPGADARTGDCIQTPNPGSAARRSPVIHCAKRRNLKIFSGPPSQIQWKLSTSGFHTIHSLKSTPQRSAAVWISTLKN